MLDEESGARKRASNRACFTKRWVSLPWAGFILELGDGRVVRVRSSVLFSHATAVVVVVVAVLAVVVVAEVVY